jgi:hypothetical protein
VLWANHKQITISSRNLKNATETKTTVSSRQNFWAFFGSGKNENVPTAPKPHDPCPMGDGKQQKPRRGSTRPNHVRFGWLKNAPESKKVLASRAAALSFAVVCCESRKTLACHHAQTAAP